MGICVQKYLLSVNRRESAKLLKRDKNDHQANFAQTVNVLRVSYEYESIGFVTLGSTELICIYCN